MTDNPLILFGGEGGQQTTVPTGSRMSHFILFYLIYGSVPRIK